MKLAPSIMLVTVLWLACVCGSPGTKLPRPVDLDSLQSGRIHGITNEYQLSSLSEHHAAPSRLHQPEIGIEMEFSRRKAPPHQRPF